MYSIRIQSPNILQSQCYILRLQYTSTHPTHPQRHIGYYTDEQRQQHTPNHHNYIYFTKFIQFIQRYFALLATCFHAGFLLGLFFDHNNEGDIFLRNVGWLSTDYTALYPRRCTLRSYFSIFNFLTYRKISMRWITKLERRNLHFTIFY
jgi:hypothetical protein